MRIAAYTYAADLYCPDCILPAFHPGNASGDPESLLPDYAEALGIDRGDERTFDSGDFPKVAFADQLEIDDRCGGCGRWLKATEIYRIVVAMPGCLPESEPYDVAGEDAAHDALVDEVYAFGDAEEDPSDVYALRVEAEKNFSVTLPGPGGYVAEAVRIPLTDGKPEEALR